MHQYFNISNTNISPTDLYTIYNMFSSFLYNDNSLCAIHKIKVILFSVSRGVINYYILVASPVVYFVVTHYIGYCTCAMLIVGGVRRGEPK
jgi:hypothetical protein